MVSLGEQRQQIIDCCRWDNCILGISMLGRPGSPAINSLLLKDYLHWVKSCVLFFCSSCSSHEVGRSDRILHSRCRGVFVWRVAGGTLVWADGKTYWLGWSVLMRHWYSMIQTIMCARWIFYQRYSNPMEGIFAVVELSLSSVLSIAAAVRRDWRNFGGHKCLPYWSVVRHHL